VAITGTWGYGATIIPDVWDAVRGKAAADIADAYRTTADGVQISVKDMDYSATYSDSPIGQLANWRATFDDVCNLYRRPLRQFLRKTEAPFV